MKHGRVGSIFSDPQLTGNAAPYTGSPSSNGQPVHFDSEGNEIELISGSEVIVDEGPWGEAMDAIESNGTTTAIKVLVYDGQGFWMCHKRLSSGRFTWWPSGERGEQAARTLQACELQVLLMAGDPSQAHAAPAWRALSLAA